jgi:phosphoglycerate kinase
MTFKTLDTLSNIHGKRVLVREDLNVPMADGKVSDATRLAATAATLKELSAKGAIVLVLAHFGRPKGEMLPECSLKPVVPALAAVLGQEVGFIEDCIGVSDWEGVSDASRAMLREEGTRTAAAVAALAPGSITVLENTRYHKGEEKNAANFAKAMAALGDIYVNDAFSAAHRAHASTEGLAHLLPAYAGRAMQAELEALEKALGRPQHPVAAVVGGAKVSSKIDVLNHLVSKVDHLIIGGGMANTFLAAQGVDVGKSLCEHDLAEVARGILARAEAANCTVHLPYDVAVAKAFAANPPSLRHCNIHEIAADEMVLDVGTDAVERLGDVLKTCKTLVWNGPMGAFELAPFDAATVALAHMAAALTQEGSLISVAGGGDTVAALNHAGVVEKFSFVSTAGGAFLEWMEGRTLPGVHALLV